jgi:4-amino-4-deoxy-L-arabinose transferase-like glycosyltransferase
MNLWGNRWGAPNFWHPDEILKHAIPMATNYTLNPHYFAYGGLHYSILIADAIAPVWIGSKFSDPRPDRLNTVADAQWKERQKIHIMVIARSISALMSTSVVYFTFMIATALFDKRVGHLAALLLALSMAFVGIAHFATVDAPANFWYWLSCLFALLIWKRGDRRWYLLAAFTAGLAIGTKVDRAVVIFPLLLSHLLRRDAAGSRALLWFLILIPVGFVLSNPALILSTFEFLDGFTRELFSNMHYMRWNPSPQTPFLQKLLANTRSGLGLPLFVTALAGLAYGLYALARNQRPAEMGWLLATFLPYCILFGTRMSAPWYVPLFFPPLMILAAYGYLALLSAMPQWYTWIPKAGIMAVVGYSFLYTLALVLQLSNDSRYQASQWIEQYVPTPASIETLGRGPVISKEKYHVTTVPPDKIFYDFVVPARDRLARDQTYQYLREAILAMEKWAGRWGLPVRNQPYLAWSDSPLARFSEHPGVDPSGAEAVLKRQPDYVVVIEGVQQETLSVLSAPDSGYRLAAEFHFKNSFGIQPDFEFVNPKLYIFQREITSFNQSRTKS